MNTYQELIPAVRCLDGQAAGWRDRMQREDFLEVCAHYSHNGADRIFVWDESETDESHDLAIGLMKEAVRIIDAPVIAGGHIMRLEDVKKYLYAGAQAVFLDMSREEQIDLLKEAADRFGSEKIYAYLPSAALTGRAEEWIQLGASALILDFPENMEVSRELADRLAADSEDGERPGLFAFLEERLPSDCMLQLKETGLDGLIFSVPSETSFAAMKQELKQAGIPVSTLESSVSWSDFKTNGDGLVPVIVQDYRTLEVLMLAYMNREAFEATLERGKMTYYSRSRQCLWLKGETSGHYQYVKSLDLDCDNDTILAKVAQVGAACHTGARSCFFQNLVKKEYRDSSPLKVFEEVSQVIHDRKLHPKEGSYTNYLFDKGIDKILKKLGEEATEIVIAAKNPNPEEVKYEISDFLYHMMVLMEEKKVSWEDITEELANRG